MMKIKVLHLINKFSICMCFIVNCGTESTRARFLYLQISGMQTECTYAAMHLSFSRSVAVVPKFWKLTLGSLGWGVMYKQEVFWDGSLIHSSPKIYVLQLINDIDTTFVLYSCCLSSSCFLVFSPSAFDTSAFNFPSY